MTHLGGSSLFLGDDVGFGTRESVADFGRVLSQYVDVIVVRAHRPRDGRRAGRVLHLPGDQRADRLRPSLPGPGRSVHAPRAASAGSRATRWPTSATATTSPAAWPWAAASWACSLSMATPQGYRFDDAFLARLAARGARAGPDGDRRSGRGGPRRASAVYTDVWASMGQESGSASSAARDFADYQVNAKLMSHAPAGRLLHALPAGPPRRGSDRRGDRRPAERRRASRPPTACTCRRESWPGCSAGRNECSREPAA